MGEKRPRNGGANVACWAQRTSSPAPSSTSGTSPSLRSRFGLRSAATAQKLPAHQSRRLPTSPSRGPTCSARLPSPVSSSSRTGRALRALACWVISFGEATRSFDACVTRRKLCSVSIQNISSSFRFQHYNAPLKLRHPYQQNRECPITPAARSVTTGALPAWTPVFAHRASAAAPPSCPHASRTRLRPSHGTDCAAAVGTR